jgi:hypothetical protein
MGETVESSHVQPTKEKVSSGLDFKFIMPKALGKKFKNSKEELLVGSRYIEQVPVALLISEKEANVVLRTHNDGLDYIGFLGKTRSSSNGPRNSSFIIGDQQRNGIRASRLNEATLT